MKIRTLTNPQTIQEAQQSYLELENLIEENIQMDYSFKNTYTVEANLKGIINPLIIFDQLFYKNNNFFDHKEFYNAYTQTNAHNLNEFRNQVYPNMPWKDFRKGLKARIYRTFCGFLTESTAFSLIKTILEPKIISRNIEEDKLGVDFRIFYKENIFNIHIFIDKQRSKEFKKIKSEERNVDSMKGYHIDLPYSLSRNKNNSVKMLKNNFGVYSLPYVKSLIKTMDAIIK